MLTSSCVTGHVDLHVGKDLVEISHPAKKEIMLTKSMMLMLIVEIDHHVGIPKKDLVEILDETKQGRCSSTFVDDIGHGSNASVCVCVCVCIVCSRSCARVRIVH